jgi:ABC-type hemin transport system substrate-binding protein
VGVDDFVQHPPDVKTKPRVGGVMNTNYEAVLALRPTHVLVDVSMKEHLQKY